MSAVFQSIPFVLHYIGGWTKSTALIVEHTAAVMWDQVLALKVKGISSEFINHEQTDHAAKQAVVPRESETGLHISKVTITTQLPRDAVYR